MIFLECGFNVLGQTFSPTHFLVAAVVCTAMLETSQTFGFEEESESFLQGLPQYELVHPSRVNAKGHFLSNFLSHRVNRVRRRETSGDPGNSARVFYQLQHGGRSLHFNLTLNPHLLAPGFLTERRYGGLKGAKISSHGSSQCHFIGEVWDQVAVKGRAAISTCDGLTGLFKLSGEDFFIRPVEQPSEESAAPQAHVIYKRHAPSAQTQVVQSMSGDHTTNGTCGVKDPDRVLKRVERQRERWERGHRRRRRRIRQRSVSRERWVETLVVADSKMVEYHGTKGVESYVLAIMNIVSGLFRDASIGNAINIVVVRLILLEKDEEDLKISHHADNSLNSFCKWQKRFNVKGDEHAVHHDVAVLLTRKDICAGINKPCETLGLSHVAGMCQPHRSCSISEDTGLPLAFTVSHELGHNFGIQHDGNGNDCQPIGKRPFVMSPQLLYGTSTPSWSRCSRQYITRFLDRGWGWCLDDPPVREPVTLRAVAPGVLYSAAHQCRLQYGSGSLLCDDVDNVCSTLWCTVGTTCHSKLDGAVDGTKCGEDKWCYDGECVAFGYRPEKVNGGWAPWSEWSACSRTCGAGVQNAQRDCVTPVPKYGGRYCLGERRRYRVCNSTPCPPGQPTFRHTQCSHFNTMPYKGKFYKWVQVNNRVNPCELHCRPLVEYFSEKMLDAVIDGTQCYEGSLSRDVCVNGICKNVGCDYQIDSNAVEDRCGVCQGNGSTCETVKKTYEDSEGLGYVDIGLIPEGARDIRIEEVAEAGNFLALRSDDPDKYFLNGGWTIQWNGDYKAAGTVFTYERTGHLENLTSPGPTLEPVWIQETNPGVRYEYTISRETALDSDNDIPITDFFWKYGSWTECSATCGTGVQRQLVHCLERTSGIVEERYCDLATRPDDRRASCNEELCPAIWWMGEWHKCSSSCGASGQAKRTVICIQAVGLEEQRALQASECQHLPRPESVAPCNTHIPCPADWTTGNWSECSLTCGGGLRNRNVTCSRNTGVDCDRRKKPSLVTPCYLRDCPPIVDIFGGNDWSGSGSSSKEVLNEINSIPNAKPPPKYSVTRAQPRAPNNLNTILDGDVPQRNRIENTPDQTKSVKNNVKVDDFYYDYNFINFHEDLSYDDLESNGKDLGDNLGPDPQRKPDSSASTEDNVDKETITGSATSASPVALISTTSPYAITDESPSQDHVNDNDNPPTEKPDEIISENEDVFLSEDYFLPVTSSPSLSTPVSVTRFAQRWTDLNSNLGWPQNLSTAPGLVSTGEGTSKDMNGKEENTDIFEDFDKEVVDVSVKYTTSTPVGQDYNDGTVPVGVVGEEREDMADSDYNSHDETTTELQSPGSQAETESPVPPLHSLPPATVVEFETYDDRFFTTTLSQWDKATPKTPLPTISLPYGQPNTAPPDYDGFLPEEPDFDQQDFDIEPSVESEGDLAVTDSDLTVTSRPVFQEPLPPPSLPSFLSPPLSGTPENVGHFGPTTGTDSLPYTDLKGDLLSLYPYIVIVETHPSTAKPETETHISRQPTEGTRLDGANTSPLAPSPYNWSEIDYNEILVPPMLKSTGPDPPLTYQPPEDSTTTPRGSMTPVPSTQSPGSTVPPLLTQTSTSWLAPAPTSASVLTPAPIPASTPVQTSAPASTPVQTSAPASTPVQTSAPASTPVQTSEPASTPVQTSAPASTPVQTSAPASTPVQTSEPASTPVQTSEPASTPVQTSEPASTPVQTSEPASTRVTTAAFWVASNWSACSTSCGLGAIWRVVVCTTGVDSDCNLAKRPVPARRCYLRPCSAWRIGEWTKCSNNCGGGRSLREVQCFDTRDQRPLRPFHCQAVSTRPGNHAPCNPLACLDWYRSSWGECSEQCGGGEQQRVVTCPEEDRCDEHLLPSRIQACNSHPCAQWVTGSWGQCSASCGGGVQRRLVKCVNIKAEMEGEEEEHAQCDHEPWPENNQKCNLQECDSTPSAPPCLHDRLTFRFCQTLQWLGRCQLPTVRAQCCKTCGQRSRGNERTSSR